MYAKKDQLPERDFELYKLLDIGDFIGVEGRCSGRGPAN